MQFTGNVRVATAENPHANSNYYLQMYQKYEKFVQKENKKIFRKQRSKLLKEKKRRNVDSKNSCRKKGKNCHEHVKRPSKVMLHVHNINLYVYC